MALHLLKSTVIVVTLVLKFTTFCEAACRYRFTEQPNSVISCNPYTNGRLATTCAMTHEGSEIHQYSLSWIFITTTGTSNTLTSGSSGGKYVVTQIHKGTNVKSQLVVNSLGSSDEGSYFCQAIFTNGSSLPRSQEVNLFTRIVYDGKATCNTSKIESIPAHRCVLFVGEVVLNKPSPTAPSSATAPTNASLTTTMAESATTVSSTSTEDDEKGTTTTLVMVPHQPKQNEGEEENAEGGLSVTNIVLYLAIGAVVLLVIIIVMLIICICLCNRACDCCQLCS